jgi:DNA-nicking Smr family endonuclease
VDFGNILDQWEQKHEVYDKDAEDPALNGQRVSASEQRRRLLLRQPDASIDLHGLTRDDAWTALNQFFATARRQGFCQVGIIHGKGNHSQGEAVLKRTVQEFIERCPFAGESGHSNAANGGSGATWVLLKTGGD